MFNNVVKYIKICSETILCSTHAVDVTVTAQKT